jgi:geranylgeranyl diphosphate synthase type I
VQETTRLAALIQERIDDELSRHRSELEELGPDGAPVLDEAREFLTGGKRLRARFAALGFQAVQPLNLFADPEQEFSAMLDAACALELFHAAALIHDDVIDRSETRRGRLSAHHHFAKLHSSHGWRGEADHFGISTAILLGDLLQSWADEMFDRAVRAVPGQAGFGARVHFNRMRSEVAIGQYLDVLEEQQPTFAGEAEQLERSTRVLVYKSAKYSVEAPLLIGAALAGAAEEQEQALREFGLPVGVAFQLRDDLLGVFGDTAVTGKPSGDDLIEGKRTVLVTLARQALPATQQRVFDDMIGDRELDSEQLGMLQHTITMSGAVTQVEQMITRNVDRAEAALDFAPLDKGARERLIELAHLATKRTA